MGRGRWGLLGWEDGWREMKVLGMRGWVEGNWDTWDGRTGKGRWGHLGWEDG